MHVLRNKLNWSLTTSTFVGVMLMMTVGCESVQEANKTDQKKVPAIKNASDQNPQSSSTDSGSSMESGSSKEPGSTSTDSGSDPEVQDQSDKIDEPKWIGEAVALFDGESLEGWETIEFGGEGDSTIEKGVLALAAGDPFTGISSTSDSLPKTNYELSLEARKTYGTDFFCGLTFPVADSHCTLIVGGWGGGTVGLSCIDDKDASSNETCTYMKFEKEQWYKIRVRVEPAAISVWIDDEQVVNQDITGRRISLRGDTDLCKPLGMCSFMTDAEYKNIQYRQFHPMKTPAKKPNENAIESPAKKTEAVKEE